MILTPHSHPDLFERIPGTVANVSKDIAPIEVHKLDATGGRAIWSKTTQTFPHERKISPQGGCWNFRPGLSYKLTFPEILIPENCVGELWPRSKLLRMGVFPGRSAIWDPGYNGKGVAIILPTQVMKLGVGIETHTFVLWEFKGSAKLYDGQFQGEGLDPRRLEKAASDIGATAEKLNKVLGDQSETVSVKPKEVLDLSPEDLKKKTEESLVQVTLQQDKPKKENPHGPVSSIFEQGAIRRPNL